MSINNHKLTTQAERGFTIVELLIVIVVIGILAAITIVSFNGVTARANTANAQSAAESTIKKIEAYNAEKSGYPDTISGTLKSTTNSGTSYYLTGVDIDSAGVLTTSNLPGKPSEINFLVCGTGSTTAKPTTPVGTATTTAVTTITGAQVNYWDYQTKAIVTMSTGVTSGLVGTNNVGCVITT